MAFQTEKGRESGRKIFEPQGYKTVIFLSLRSIEIKDMTDKSEIKHKRSISMYKCLVI